MKMIQTEVCTGPTEMLQTEVQTIKLKNHTLELLVSPGRFFVPNAVTRLFSKSVKINQGDTVIDMGFGVGVLAIWAALEPSKEVHAVEKNAEQCELAVCNVRKYNLENKIHLYNGSLFEPLPSGLKVDVIMGDVSGIAESPARVLGWYPKPIDTGGIDGTEVLIPLIEQAGSVLKPNGRFYIPIGTLSDYKKIFGVLESKFRSIEIKEAPTFPLKYEQVLNLINDNTPGKYTIRKNRDKWVWDGWIYEATNPK